MPCVIKGRLRIYKREKGETIWYQAIIYIESKYLEKVWDLDKEEVTVVIFSNDDLVELAKNEVEARIKRRR